MINKYFFPTDENQVYNLYNKLFGEVWPIGQQKFYDVIVHNPPSSSVMSFTSTSEGKLNGFISTQISGSKGSIVLLLFEPGQEQVGEKLLNEALDYLKEKQVTSVQLGAGGYSYFWPGVPSNLPKMVSFFESQGWEFNENSVDMIGEIGNYVTPTEVMERISSIGVSIQFASHDEAEKVLMFEKQNFPNWERYFSETINKKQFNEILIAKTSQGEVIGSALVRKQDVVWAALLGENVGTIGALGVSESMRGKGVGLALAAKATEALKERNVEVCYLGWTWLTDWYGKLGYVTWREYRMGWRTI